MEASSTTTTSRQSYLRYLYCDCFRRSCKNFEKVCELCYIALNKITVFDDNGTITPRGLRIGIPAMTSRGCLEADFETRADFLLRAAQITSTDQRGHGKLQKAFLKGIQNNKDIVELRTQVEKISAQFALPGLDA